MSAGSGSIVLIGFMGAGKSAVGRKLARALAWPCLETDELVATDFGLTIPEIFEKFGESCFREAESAALARLEGTTPAVIVTGGGIVLRPENGPRLRELGTVVWLTADLEVLRERLAQSRQRPLLQTPDPRVTIERLWTQRQRLYDEAADLRIDTSRLSLPEVVKKIRDGMPR